CHPAVVMRKDVALAAGGYRKALLDAEDYDLWLRMSERTKLANLDQVLLKYRVHPRQMSIQKIEHQTWCVLAARAAAAVRKRGKPDPLSQVNEVTRQLLGDLGLTDTEIRRALVDVYRYWIGVLYQSDPELALRINGEALELSSANSIQRRVLADLWLTAAAIHYKQGRF